VPGDDVAGGEGPDAEQAELEERIPDHALDAHERSEENGARGEQAEDRRQRDDDDGAIDRRHEHREARVRQGHPPVAGRHQMFCARWAGIGADSDVAEVPDVDGGVLGSLSRGVDRFPTVRFRAH